MNKKGFTLVEILGVIAILGILGIIAMPIIINVINNNAKTIDSQQEKMIIRAAKNYVSSKVFENVTCVNVSKLKTDGYLDDLNIESNSKDVNYNNYKVIIAKSGNKYTYTLQNGNCS